MRNTVKKKKAAPEVVLHAADTAAVGLCDRCEDVHLLLLDKGDELMAFMTLSPDEALESR
jgi:hypothetical protein